MITEYIVRWRQSGLNGQLRQRPFASIREIVMGDVLIAVGDGWGNGIDQVCLRVMCRVISEDKPPTLICCETVNVFEEMESGGEKS